IAVGDQVSVTGTLSTRKPDSLTASERRIAASSITKLSSGAPVAPLALNCQSVGGGPTSFLAGVNTGAGLINTGLLVTITGRVTFTVGAFIYVDDGSNIP